MERAKEGVTEVEILRAADSMPVCKGLPAYELEYIVDSTRGKNHYLVKTTIVNRNLYVFTVQVPDAIYPKLSDISLKIIDSLHVVKPDI